ncbi:MAG: hypothetical protein ACK2U3_03080 [Anaerolineales bacterium]
MFSIPSGKNFLQTVTLLFLSLGLSLAVFDRPQRREIISMAFVIMNNIGHWGMLFTLFFIPFPIAALLLFSIFMLVGDLIKTLEIYQGQLRLPGVSITLLYGLTGFYILGYTLIIFLGLIIPAG